MSNNAVQPIETSHYTYDAHKPSTNDHKQDTTHHSSSTSTALPTASKVHPVVDKPIEHPHAAPTTATSPVVASPTQHPHAAEHPHATAAAERPHAVGEHAQPSVVQHPANPTTAAVVAPKETPKHPQAASLPPQTASEPQAATPATGTPHHHVAFEQQPIIVAIIEDEDQMELQPHPHNSHHHHNRSHNHHSQYEQGEEPHHKHESPRPAHSAAGHHATPTPVNTNANDSTLTDPQAETSFVGGVEKKQPLLHSTHANNALVPSNNTLTSPPVSHAGGVETIQPSHPQQSAAHPSTSTPQPAVVHQPSQSTQHSAAHPSTATPHPSTTTPTTHPTTHHNTNANDALLPSDSILTEPSPTTSSGSNNSYSYTSGSGSGERRHSWSKDELKRGAMEGLLETEGKKKVAKGGYSSTSPH